MESLLEVNEKTRCAYNKAAKKYHELFHNEMNEKEYDRKTLDDFAAMFQQGAKVLDAGCGPSGHISKYLHEKGLQVTGVDISDECIAIASKENHGLNFFREDICKLSFEDNSFEGIVAYYSILDTPKQYVNLLFEEFRRVLKPNGYLLVTVKEGSTEGYKNELLGIDTDIYFSLFTSEEIASYFTESGFAILYSDVRNPYDFEINNNRIFTLGVKL